MNRAETVEKFEKIIKAQGKGAPKRIEALVSAASAGNAAAKAELEKVFECKMTSMLDLWDILTAATNLMTPGELKQMELKATQKLNAGVSSIHDADIYLSSHTSIDNKEATP